MKLEDIKKEVGNRIFNDWEAQANREMAATPNLFKGEDARHRYLHAQIEIRYEAYKRVFGKQGLMEGFE